MSIYTPEDVYELLQVEDLPGTEEEKEIYLVTFTRDLVERKGRGWVRENRLRLIGQWRQIVFWGPPP